MSSKVVSHTPGPWLVHPSVPMFVIAECDQGLVANCDDPNNQNEARSNARLIAAAPELLQAVRAAQQMLFFALRDGFEADYARSLQSQLNAVMDKAEGQS